MQGRSAGFPNPGRYSRHVRRRSQAAEGRRGNLIVSYSIVIPARYASTRLPGKPLRLLAGKPILQHVYACATTTKASTIIIATDSDDIRVYMQNLGAEVCMTSPEHQSGTERIAEVIRKMSLPDDEIIVNLQGDEPFMPADCIEQVASMLGDDRAANVATLCTPITAVEQIFDSNVVKVVTDKNGYALYFSRAPIPWQRDHFESGHADLDGSVTFQRHIGLYAYRAGYVLEYVQLPRSPLEETEKLEQLRVLWNAGRIAITEAVKIPGPGIDTSSDLEQAEQQVKSTQ